MRLLTNKDIRYLFWIILVILTLTLFSSLIFLQLIVSGFKAQMLTHDYEIAGYLLEHGAKPSDVSDAFAARKTEEEFLSGKNLLHSLGYKLDVNNQLLPDANELVSKYRLYSSLSVVIFGTSIITVFFVYFKRQQNVIEKANIAINTFVNGDATARIDSDKEGSLYKLFASINSITTSLNAHIEVEKHTKEFLKNLIADISHQLKTPLAALKMYNEIMQEESNNEETVKNFAVKMESSLERMEILIQNLLKITKLDAGTIVLNKREKNIRAIVKESISSLETRAAQEQKSITLNGSDNTVLYCDEDWMIEAIGNLIKNALDHMREGGKVIILWEETSVITKIIIKDNGSGIYPEDIHYIFKRFYRSRFSQNTHGVGLGLSLAKSIVEAHNGTITVDSTLGKGSSFALNFLKLTNM
ncbi:sensor histidine kinase [Brassicibacter mesophilus]|uniref:sensor histidine kinase n=1 Tax=Brassicibacter mesophilus TaxID=745119 RepID=UPI003D2161BD